MKYTTTITALLASVAVAAPTGNLGSVADADVAKSLAGMVAKVHALQGLTGTTGTTGGVGLKTKRDGSLDLASIADGNGVAGIPAGEVVRLLAEAVHNAKTVEDVAGGDALKGVGVKNKRNLDLGGAGAGGAAPLSPDVLKSLNAIVENVKTLEGGAAATDFVKGLGKRDLDVGNVASSIPAAGDVVKMLAEAASNAQALDGLTGSTTGASKGGVIGGL